MQVVAELKNLWEEKGLTDYSTMTGLGISLSDLPVDTEDNDKCLHF